MKKNETFINWFLFSVLCIIWGSSFILMRWSTEGLKAAEVASLRIFSAGIVFLPFGIFHVSKIPAKKIFMTILIAIMGNLLPAYLFAAAIARSIDSALAGILNSLTPIFVVVISIAFFKSKIKSRKILGVLLAFAGLCLLTLSKSGISFENLKYAGWILLATVFYGINVNLVSHYMKEVNPIHLATVSLSFMIIPTAFLLWQQDFLSLSFDDAVIRWSVISSLLLGVAGSAVATALFYMLVTRAGGLFASLVTYGIPFVAIAWGLIYGENITMIQVACLCVILCGVYFANR